MPSHAVNVHVDEAGHDIAPADVDDGGAGRLDPRAALDGRDAVAVEEQ